MAIRRLAVAVLVPIGAMAVASCGSSPDSTGSSSTEATVAPATDGTSATDAIEVSSFTKTFVDTSRATDAGRETPAKPERTIVTRIVHPTSGGPYPLLILSHGATGHPDEYDEQIPTWAADGFVVVTPIFPLTNRDVPGALSNIADVSNQPGDVSFVIDQVLAANHDPSSPLYGMVDPDAIGVVGHSLGGATTWAVGFDTLRRDARVKSVTIFASFAPTMPGSELDLDSGLPLLVLHGDADDVPIELDRMPYEQAASPKWFVTLLGADHRLAFTDEPSPYDELVTRTILDFWHGTLDGDAEALARVTADATEPGLSRAEHE